MRRFLSALFGASLLCAVALPAAAAQTGSAPADEYFGRYHMSVLGIRNAIHDMTGRAEADPDHAPSLLKSAELTENAMHDWGMHYPSDTWLPKMIVSLERLYLSIGGPVANRHAQETVAWLDAAYPDSNVTRMSHAMLAQADESVDAAPVSDDGTTPADNGPATLGMVPGLVSTTIPPSVDAADPASATDADSAP